MVKNQLAVAVQAAIHSEFTVSRPLDPAPAVMVSPAMTAADATTPAACWVGIDVAKAHRDVALWPTQERLHVTRDEAGLGRS